MNLLALILCSLTTPNHAVSYNSYNITSDYPVHPPTLSLCKSSAALPGKVELPALTEIDGAVLYTLSPFRLHKDAFECPSGTEPSNPFETLSVTEFNKLDDKSESNKYSLRVNNTFIWDNGYLSLGTGHNNITYYSTKNCIQEISGVDDNIVVTIKACTSSSDRTFLQKCCPPWLILSIEGSCISYPGQDPLKHKYLDEASSELVPYSKVNPSIRHELLSCGGEIWESDECDVHFYPTLTGKLAFLGANRRWEYFSGKYCIEQYLVGNSIRTAAYVCPRSASVVKDAVVTSTVLMVSLYIGSFFHFLTSLVYGITWRSQNFHGKTLFSCTLSLFAMQLMLGNAHLIGLGKVVVSNKPCVANAILGQFFMLATFTWLLIVNADLWYTFSTTRADTGPALKRFWGYASLGWGFPFVVTVTSVILNFQFPCRTSKVVVPEYGKLICFVAPWAQGYYIYYILGILMALTCILAVLTLRAVYSVKRDSTKLRTNQEGKNIFVLFVKLSLIMGFSWIFEVISWAATKGEHENNLLWIIFDVYNALSGILIFIIFACKRNRLTLLEQPHPIFEDITVTFRNLVSAFPSTKELTSSGATSSTGIMTGDAGDGHIL